MQKSKKNKRTGIAATLLFHGLLLLALFFLALRTPLPLPGEEGVEVDLGYSDQGMGLIQPEVAGGQTAMALPQPSEPETQKNEEILTQETEEAPAIAPKEKPKETPKPKPKPEKPIEKVVPPVEAKPEPVEAPQPKVNKRALFKGSGEANGDAGSEGITGNPGDQGRPNGLKDVKRYEGQGGQGNGPAFSLGGRGALKLAEPKTSFREQGNVVVDIWVDRKGVVTKAEVSVRGTTVVDANLRNLAVKAALNSRFTEDSQATSLQKGTITYTFIIGN